jgi:hypothetical protein
LKSFGSVFYKGESHKTIQTVEFERRIDDKDYSKESDPAASRVVLINTHMPWRNPVAAKKLFKCYERELEREKGHHKDVFLCGDFNRTYEQLRAEANAYGFVSACIGLGQFKVSFTNRTMVNISTDAVFSQYTHRSDYLKEKEVRFDHVISNIKGVHAAKDAPGLLTKHFVPLELKHFSSNDEFLGVVFERSAEEMCKHLKSCGHDCTEKTYNEGYAKLKWCNRLECSHCTVK